MKDETPSPKEFPGDETQSMETSAPSFNPFESPLLSQLSTSVWSPSTMNICNTPDTQTDWNISQMARLWPVDIENSPSSHMNPYPVNPARELQAQADIDTFFSQSVIVPSPEATTWPRRLLQARFELEEIETNRISTINPTIPSIMKLSFGSPAPGCSNASLASANHHQSFTPFESPIKRLSDPLTTFHHEVFTPNSSSPCFTFDTSSTELVKRMKRCQFTPEPGSASGLPGSPAITPIRDEDEEELKRKIPFKERTSSLSNNSLSLYTSTPTGRFESAPASMKITRRRTRDLNDSK